MDGEEFEHQKEDEDAVEESDEVNDAVEDATMETDSRRERVDGVREKVDESSVDDVAMVANVIDGRENQSEQVDSPPNNENNVVEKDNDDAHAIKNESDINNEASHEDRNETMTNRSDATMNEIVVDVSSATNDDDNELNITLSSSSSPSLSSSSSSIADLSSPESTTSTSSSSVSSVQTISDVDDDEDNNMATNRDDDEEEQQRRQSLPPVLRRPQPKCRYKLLSDLRNRELLRSNRKPYSARGSFVLNRLGSLSLLTRLELSSKLDYHRGCVNALHFNASGNLLASGSDDLDVAVWDWQKKKKLYVVNTNHKSNVFQCKFLSLSTDSHIVTSARDGYVRLAEISQGSDRGRDSRKLAHHSGPAHKLTLLPTQRHCILSGGEDAVVYHVDVRQPRATKLMRQVDEGTERKVAIYSIDASKANDNFFCTAGKDKLVRIYDRRAVDSNKAKPLRSLCPKHLASEGSRYNVTCAVFSHDGDEVVASYNDDDIYLFKITGNEEDTDYHKKFQGHRNSATVKGVNFYGGRSEFVVSGSDCGHVFFWSKETEAIAHVVQGDDSGVVNVLEPHPNLPSLATSGLDSEVKIWMPTAHKRVDFNRIEKIVRKNNELRQRGEVNDPEGVDGQMLWMLWRHIRRIEQRRSRRNREGGEENVSDASNNEEDDEDDDDDDDSDSSQHHALQCPTS